VFPSVFPLAYFPASSSGDKTMSVLSGETFMTSISRDILEDWLAVLFQENQTKPECESSLDTEVVQQSVCSVKI